jgi:hypothetical protein
MRKIIQNGRLIKGIKCRHLTSAIERLKSAKTPYSAGDEYPIWERIIKNRIS